MTGILRLLNCNLNLKTFFSFFSDSFESRQSSTGAINDFVRLNRTLATWHEAYSTGLSLDDFMAGCHVLGYDLTAGQTGGVSAMHTPLVRTGVYRIKCKFSESIPRELDLQMFAFSEVNDVMFIHPNNKVSMSTNEVNHFTAKQK